MTDLLVLGQDPRFGGGALAQIDAFLAGARALGRTPELRYSPHPALDGRRLSPDRIEALRQARGARRLASRAADARSLWVVAAVASHGGAAPRAGRPYACWLATSVDDEWRGRRRGLAPARRSIFAAGLPALRRLERAVIRDAAAVYAISPASCAAVAEAGRVDASEVALLPIPVDVEEFAPAPQAQSEPVLVFVGRADDPRKNVRLLLEAAPLLRRRLPEARIRLVGEPPRGPLPDGVEATGMVPSVAEELRRAALFVLPSRQEGFALVAAEALAAGVPVVTTPSGGPQELVRSSGAGVVLSGFEPEELAETAARLLEDAGTLSAMRERGRAYVVREHSQERFRELLAAALARLDEA